MKCASLAGFGLLWLATTAPWARADQQEQVRFEEKFVAELSAGWS